MHDAFQRRNALNFPGTGASIFQVIRLRELRQHFYLPKLSSKWRETHPERLYTSHGLDAPYWSARRGNLSADLGERYGGVMRIIPGIIIPAILALGVAGSILSGAEMTVAAAHAPAAHAHVVAASAIPLSKYHD